MKKVLRTHLLFLTAVLVLMLPITVCCARPKVIDTIFPTDDIVIANIVVNIPQNNAADATPSIQSAIDQVSKAGGGVVFLPAGRYKLDGNLIVKKGVTLRGDWSPPTSKGWQRGTILIPSAGRGNADDKPAIQLLSNCGVRNLAIWYVDQDANNPIPYPWSISSSLLDHLDKGPTPPSIVTDPDNNNSQTVLNVTLVNSYKGIIIGRGSECNFLHRLRNIYGTVLKTGLSIDTCVDIGRTENVDFRPDWWEKSGLPNSPVSKSARVALRNFMFREGNAIDIGRDEWGYLYHIKAKGYSKGIVFRTGWGNTNGVVFGSKFLDCDTALQLDDVCQFGIAFTGCEFSGSSYAVYAPKTYTGVVAFNNCLFESGGKNGIHSDGPGAITLMNCYLRKWQEAAMDITNGYLSVMGSKFDGSGTHMLLGQDVKTAIIMSNKFAGAPSIVNNAKQIDLQVSHQQIPFARPDISLMTPAPDRRPATRKLFVVTDFGANTATDDNTGAFAKALNSARKSGGGTVYVPAGVYRFKGEIIVPSGVELRGCYDVAHHTVGAGSALLPTSGKGNPNGTPFIRMKPGSGLRGLTVWYPEQDPASPQTYPWTVQGLGPRCWIINLNCGNSYQGIDFWTHPSDGHVVRHLTGAYFNKGLFISKCKGEGWVDDVQFNPHFLQMVDPILKPVPVTNIQMTCNYQRSHLEAMVFGRCDNEHISGTFEYSAQEGLSFRDDNGGTNARVIHHGTDNGARGVAIDAVGSKGIEFINTQLVPNATGAKGGIVVGNSFAGKASFFNTNIFICGPAADIGGKGNVLIQQIMNTSGPIRLKGGKCELYGGYFKSFQTPAGPYVFTDWQKDYPTNYIDPYTSPLVCVEKGCKSAQMVGNIATYAGFEPENMIGAGCHLLANSLPDKCKSSSSEKGILTQ